VGGCQLSLVRSIWMGTKALAPRSSLDAITAIGKGTMVLILPFCDCIGVEGGIWPRSLIGIKPETSVCSKYIK
jgi:hypothetical protein